MMKRIAGLLIALLVTSPVLAQDLIVDNQEPIIEITSPLSGAVVSGTMDIRATVQDANLASYRVWVQDVDSYFFADSGTVFATESFTDQSLMLLDTAALPDDFYYIYVSAKDSWGNMKRVSVSARVDNSSVSRSAEITSPQEGAVVSGNIRLSASLFDDDTNDRVSWAVRKGTCAAGTGTVLGNVDGRNDSYEWFDNKFSAIADTDLWEDGEYCFVFNPSEGAGEDDIRLTRRFEVVNDIPATPQILGFLNPNLACGSITNAGIVTVDWSDSSDANGIAGYHYQIDYPLSDGTGRGVYDNFFTSSQYRGSLNEGVHYIKVRAKDSAGNYSEWSNVCSITLDTIDPGVGIIIPENDSVVYGNLDIVVSIEDANLRNYTARIKDSLGNIVASSGKVDEESSFWNRTVLSFDTKSVAGGKYFVEVEAEDKAGNVGYASAEIEIASRPMTKEECKSGGWRSFSSLGFDNQGSCISYIQSNENAGKR